MKKTLQWYLFTRWSKRIRVAIQRCRVDKGYVTERDWEEIRAGEHWAMHSNVRTLAIEIVREARTHRSDVIPVFW